MSEVRVIIEKNDVSVIKNISQYVASGDVDSFSMFEGLEFSLDHTEDEIMSAVYRFLVMDHDEGTVPAFVLELNDDEDAWILRRLYDDDEVRILGINK